MVVHSKCATTLKVHSTSSKSFDSVLQVLVVRFKSSGLRSVLGPVMSSVSHTGSGLTAMRGMIEEQSVQSASVEGSMKSSDSVIDASVMCLLNVLK